MDWLILVLHPSILVAVAVIGGAAAAFYQLRVVPADDKMAAAAAAWAAADAALVVAASGAERARFSCPRRCMLTGGNGMVGRRLAELLIERGAERVVSLDLREVPAADRDQSGKVEYLVGDICDAATVAAACEGVDCVFHLAALVS